MRDRQFKASQWVPNYSLGEWVEYVRPGREQVAVGQIVAVDVHHYWFNSTPGFGYSVMREGKRIHDHIGDRCIRRSLGMDDALAARGEKGVQS